MQSPDWDAFKRRGGDAFFIPTELLHRRMIVTPLISAVLVAVSLCCCNAQMTNCSASKMTKGILYRIQEFSASGCYYSWMNLSGHVLANQDEKNDELVYFSNKTDILILECCESIKYRRICRSEGFEVMAVCNTTCHEDPKNNASDPTLIIVISAVLCCLLALVLISSLLFFVCRRIRRGYNQGNQNPNEDEEANL